jgi:hypothetical protein
MLYVYKIDHNCLQVGVTLGENLKVEKGIGDTGNTGDLKDKRAQGTQEPVDMEKKRGRQIQSAGQSKIGGAGSDSRV